MHVCCLIKHTTGSASFQCKIQFHSCVFFRICASNTIPTTLQGTKCDPWHAILQADIARIRQVYDAFLQDFPLCFGYWKKYADAELKHTSVEAAVRVYERGVAAIAYSADLWGQYAVFKQDKGFSPGAVIR